MPSNSLFGFSISATSAQDAVLKPAVDPARKQWGKPQMTQIISALGNAKLQTATTTMGGSDEPDAARKPQFPVVTQSSPVAPCAAMGATITVQNPTVPPMLGVTVVKSTTGDSPKTVIMRKDKVEEASAQGEATLTISGTAEENTKKSLPLETISERTKEGDTGKEGATVKAENSEDLSIEDVENITEEKPTETSAEKPAQLAPKSPVKAWGEGKACTSTESKFHLMDQPVNSPSYLLLKFVLKTRFHRAGKNAKKNFFKVWEESRNPISSQGH